MKKIKLIPRRIINQGKRILKRGCLIVQRRLERLKIKLHIYKKVEVSVDDLIMRQCRSDELMRCDMIVRLMAIENYYGYNECGLELYRKMQDLRVGAGYGEKAISAFRSLIKSYENKGYDKESSIILDKNLNIIDGSHRMALAVFHHVPYISACIVNSKHPVEYSIDWFIMNGFSSKDTNSIIEKSNYVIRGINKKLCCVIWSPAQKYSCDIIKELKCYGDVENIREYRLSQGEYENSVRAVYAIDDIEKWKIEKKINHMQGYPSILTCLDITFNDLDYRIKTSTGLLLSKKAERVKKAIRTKYQKMVDDYYFDIIIHIGDNIYQSNYMREVFDNTIDFQEIVEILNNYNYCFVKTDVPYMPLDFPQKIPVGKDADILCSEEDFEKIVSEIKEHISKYVNFRIIYIQEDNGVRIRIQRGHTLYYQLDISYKVASMSDDFVRNALENRCYNERGFFVLPIRYEYIYRAYEYYRNTSKIHHLEYLHKHFDEYDVTLFKAYCDFDITDLINK